MSTSNTSEQSFEWQIEKALVGSTREERGESADVAVQSPSPEQFFWGHPKDFGKSLALDLRRLWSFLETIKTKAQGYVIYADRCILTDEELEKYHITFKKIPRDITRL